MARLIRRMPDGADTIAAVPFRHPRSAFRRLAVAMVLLGVVAQMLASQASAAHMAGLLSERWLWGNVCSGVPGGGPSGALADFDRQASQSEGDPGHVLSHCPVCAVAVLPLLAPPAAPGPAPLAVVQGVRVWTAELGVARPSPDHLLPPSQGPPVAA